jgi:hypothetical protein
MFDRDFDDLLNTVDVAAEGRNDDAARGLIENLLDASADVGFGRGVAFEFGVGGIGHEQVDAFIAKAAKFIELEIRADRSEVDLEVAGLDDAALFGIDADAEGIGDRVGDPEERDGEIIGDAMTMVSLSYSTILTLSLM